MKTIFSVLLIIGFAPLWIPMFILRVSWIIAITIADTV